GTLFVGNAREQPAHVQRTVGRATPAVARSENLFSECVHPAWLSRGLPEEASAESRNCQLEKQVRNAPIRCGRFDATGTERLNVECGNTCRTRGAVAAAGRRICMGLFCGAASARLDLSLVLLEESYRRSISAHSRPLSGAAR